MAGLLVSLTILVCIAAIAFFAVDVGIAQGVCGADSELLWFRFILSNGGRPSRVAVRGDAAAPFYNCLHVLHHASVHGDIPPDIANKMQGAPFPGTWPRCTNLTRAYVEPGHDGYYFTTWLTAPLLNDSLCPAVDGALT